VKAVELDPVVVQLARQHFGLPEGSHLQVRRWPRVPNIDQLDFNHSSCSTPQTGCRVRSARRLAGWRQSCYEGAARDWP
jgi:hypothetical protein